MFLARPSPLTYESLSSWRQRAGVANGFLLFPRLGRPKGSSDPDRAPSGNELTWLAEEYRVSSESILKTSLEFIGSAIDPNFAATTRPRWVVPAGERKATQWGPGCCPVCLAEDARPYFRISWRFAFVTACPIHGCELIDRCPSCGKGLWPSNLKAFSPNGWRGFGRCYWCGKTFSANTASPPSAADRSRKLWICASAGIVPEDLTQADTPSDVFTGLWALAQLLLRRRSAHTLTHVPSSVGNLPRSFSSSGKEIDQLELLPVSHRTHVLDSAYWLMQEWPQRFLEITSLAGILRNHFTGTHAMHPAWLKTTIENSLTRSHRNVKSEDVRAAIDSIRASGKPVSKLAVKRILGVRDARAIEEIVPSQRRSAMPRELLALCGKFERLLTTTPTARDQHATLLRDYLILLLSVLSGFPVEHVCKFAERDAISTLDGGFGRAAQESVLYSLIAKRTFEIHHLYASIARPHLMGAQVNHNQWFLSRFGGDIAGHTVREHVAKLMATGFGDDLWRSADVFLHVFERERDNPGTKRRWVIHSVYPLTDIRYAAKPVSPRT